MRNPIMGMLLILSTTLSPGPDYASGTLLSASDGTSGTLPSASDGTSGTLPSASNGTSGTFPSASDGTSGTLPSASDGTSGTLPSASNGTSGTLPSASNGTSGTLPSASNGTNGTLPSASNGTSGTLPSASDGTNGKESPASNDTSGTVPFALIYANGIVQPTMTNELALYRPKRGDKWWEIVINLLKGLSGIGTFLLDLGKDLITTVVKTATERLLDQAFREDCSAIAKACSCGWGSCQANPGNTASACCKDGYRWQCCQKAPQLIETCNKLCKCGWGDCHPKIGISKEMGGCCEPGYAWFCCEKAPEILTGCQKKVSKCPSGCTWGACHQREGVVADECCQAGNAFECCKERPKKVTDCELLKKKCEGGSGKCFPAEGHKGDECCTVGYEFKCAQDMTEEERLAAYPKYLKLWECALQGHPDENSLLKCFPDVTKCNEFYCGERGLKEYLLGCPLARHFEAIKERPHTIEELEELWKDARRGVPVPVHSSCPGRFGDYIIRCPKLLKCMLRGHLSLQGLKQCMPKDVANKMQCNEPLPPPDVEPTEETQTTSPKPIIPIETGGGRQLPFVDVLDVDNCTGMVKDLCPCGMAWCVRRDGYNRTKCCPADYDLVCCATKAKSLDVVKMEFEAQEDEGSESAPSTIADLTTASPNTITDLTTASSAIRFNPTFAMFLKAISAALVIIVGRIMPS